MGVLCCHATNFIRSFLECVILSLAGSIIILITFLIMLHLISTKKKAQTFVFVLVVHVLMNVSNYLFGGIIGSFKDVSCL